MELEEALGNVTESIQDEIKLSDKKVEVNDMGELKTPKEMAKKEVNKKLAKEIAKRVLEKKRHEAKIKKLDKEIKKIENGEIVPMMDGDDDEDDESSDSTHISFILDESGSMSGSSAVTDVNEYIQTMKKEKGHITLTLTKFNSDGVNMIFKNKPIKQIEKFKEEQYSPSGLTPLYDAVGKTINTVSGKGKKLFVILTDGCENNSEEFTKEKIQALIKDKEKQGYIFSYLGIGQDAWGGNQSLGISDKMSVRGSKASLGSNVMMFAQASSGMVRGGSFKLNKK